MVIFFFIEIIFRVYRFSEFVIKVEGRMRGEGERRGVVGSVRTDVRFFRGGIVRVRIIYRFFLKEGIFWIFSGCCNCLF